MLDHSLLDAIAALRRSLEEALLERRAVEERLQVDVLLGDVTWESSYSLPGEGDVPRVWADLTLEWPTWSQTALRSWALGDEGDDLPEVVVEVVVHLQGLASEPDLRTVVKALPQISPAMGSAALERQPPIVEHHVDEQLDSLGYGVEIAYEGTYAFAEEAIRDRRIVEVDFAALGSWVASTLVRLGDLPFEHRPVQGETGA